MDLILIYLITDMKKLRYLEPLSVRPQKQCVCLQSGPQRCFLPHGQEFIIQKW